MEQIAFSVLMPTYNQCSFIRRAILSLKDQSYPFWEIIIVDDGSTDETFDYIKEYLADERIKYTKNTQNKGLGYSLNVGLKASKYNYIAYLPSDDYFYRNHLETLQEKFKNNPKASLVYSGLRYDLDDSLHSTTDGSSKGVRRGYGMQLVQVAHKKVREKWVERECWISEDLFAMYWMKLVKYGLFLRTENITAFWTQHPHQRHRIISESHGGGINKARSYYKIKNPIKIRVAKEKFVNEEALYSLFQSKNKLCDKPLKILLVGELAYNPERICALEEAGHKLYGLWVEEPPLSFFTVGHLPFGNVEDISANDWRKSIRSIKPDIIYGLLNWGAIPLAYEVMKEFPYIPFAWHFKEGPFLAMQMGMWSKLVYLYSHATLKIYLNETVKKWFEQFIPTTGLSFVMDGDLPKLCYFNKNFSEKISARDGEIHTVVAGRMIGINHSLLKRFSLNGIHVHLYLENFHSSQADLYEYYKKEFPCHFHIHNHCAAENWVKEFSKYDAGWLHLIKSLNEGDILKATWDDLNIPARLSTYAVASIPVIHNANEPNIVAVNEIIREKKIGLLFRNEDELICKLKDTRLLSSLSMNMRIERMSFCFDSYVPSLIRLFREAIRVKEK